MYASPWLSRLSTSQNHYLTVYTAHTQYTFTYYHPTGMKILKCRTGVTTYCWFHDCLWTTSCLSQVIYLTPMVALASHKIPFLWSCMHSTRISVITLCYMQIIIVHYALSLTQAHLCLFMYSWICPPTFLYTVSVTAYWLLVWSCTWWSY